MQVLLGGRPPLEADVVHVFDAAEWSFRREVTPPTVFGSPGPRIHIHHLHQAFPSGQVSGTRLVLTQSTYQLQRWLDWERSNPDRQVTADADPGVLRQRCPEAFARRGPWSRISLVDAHAAAEASAPAPPLSDLHRAFTQPDPQLRLRACRDAAAGDPANPALLLAIGSVSMEIQDIQSALDSVGTALTHAPEWAAAHFELGKVWLRADDTPRAAAAFAEAARLMATFTTAWSNLGAALGELERPDEAIAALRRALEHDPYGHPTLNNLGVVLRELGRFEEAEAAFRQVVALAPGFVFGRYNLAQTLLVAQRYDAARQEYEEAFARDPQQSARQACRLAVARAATGDADGALDALQHAIEGLGEEVLEPALDEAERALTVVAETPAGSAAARVLRVIRATRNGST